MSDLIEHARRELKLAGLFDKDSDYGGMLGGAVMPLIAVFSSQGHSGFSASCVIDLFTKLASYKRLSELTDKPDEWMDVSDCPGRKEWQNRRQGSCFSQDGGKTYYDIDEKREIRNGVYGFVMHESKHAEEKREESVNMCAETRGASPLVNQARVAPGKSNRPPELAEEPVA